MNYDVILDMAFELGYLNAPENIVIEPEKVKDYEHDRHSQQYL